MNGKKVIIILFCISIFTVCFSQDYWESIFEYEESIHCVEINSIGFIYAGTQNGIYRSVDNGNNWENMGLENISVYCLTINSNDDIFAGTGGFYNIYNSIDLGQTWIPLHENIAPNNVISLYINFNGVIFAGSGGDYGLMRSTDNGENWELILSLASCEQLQSICETTEGSLFLGTTNFMGEGGVYRSVDQGNNWELIGLNFHFLSSLAVNSNGEIFAGSRGHYTQAIGGVYRSSDNGETWETLTNQFYVNDIAVDSQDRIFIGCIFGAVWFSEDNGETWQFIESALLPEETEIKYLTITEDDFVYSISYGENPDKVYRSLESTIINENTLNSNTCELSNYPNPFNPLTTISFTISNELHEQSELIIYNIKGQKIKELPAIQSDAQHRIEGDGNRRYSVIWNGTDHNNRPVSSGIYFYKLRSGDHELSRKMLLLK